MADSFIFYRSFREAIKFLDTESRCRIYDTICDYALDRTEIELSGVERAVFELVRPLIDANEKRRANGKKGGNVTQAKNKQKSSNIEATIKQHSSKDKANDNQVSSYASPLLDNNIDVDIDIHSNIDTNTNLNNDSDTNIISLTDKRFNQFWELYPRKEGKGAAKKKWQQINPNAELFDKIITAVQNNLDHNPQWQRNNGQYIPHPTTWLNQGRWDDDISTVSRDDYFTRELKKMGGLNFD